MNATTYQDNLLIISLNNFTICKFSTSNDLPLIILSIIFLIFALIGLLGNGLLLVVLHDAHLLHANVRLLLASMTLASTIICLGFAGRALFHILAMTLGLTWPVTNARTCAFFELPAASSTFALCLSIMTFGAERLYATWIRQTSESLSRWLVIMVICLWSTVFINVAILVNTTDNVPNMCYCHVLLCFKWSVTATTMTLYFVIEVTSFIMYLAVYRWNHTRLASFGINSATHCLSERFQISNTIRATEMLLPNIILHSICWSIIQLASYYPRTLYMKKGLTSDVVYSVAGVVSLALIHSSLHPYLTIWKSKNVRKAIRRFFDNFIIRLSRRSKATPNGTTNEILAPSLSPDSPPPTTYCQEESIFITGVEGPSEICMEQRSTANHIVAVNSIQKKGKRRKSGGGGKERVHAFKMTPEQHSELLAKYWE